MATAKATRARLSRGLVLTTAVGLADREGIAAVTMRNLASELGVEAMSLYYHFANKAELLDEMVEAVIVEINDAVEPITSESPTEWKTTLRRRSLAAREVLLRHPWAPSLIESRTVMTPTVIAYFDAVLGLLRQGGLSYDLAHHAMHALGSRALGFTQELFEPDSQDSDEEIEAALMAMADRFPHLTGMLAEVAHDEPDSTLGWCDDQTEFEFGLDLILDGLERLAATR